MEEYLINITSLVHVLDAVSQDSNVFAWNYLRSI